MDRAKVVHIRKFDELLQISDSENVEKREYVLIVGNKESYSCVEELSKKRLWRESFKEYEDSRDLRSVVRAKLRVLKDNTWFVGGEKIADIGMDVYKGGTKPENWTVKLDEDIHPYNVYKFGEEEYEVYSRIFLEYPEDVEGGRQGGRRRFYDALVGKALERVKKEEPELMEEFYEEFPEMRDFEEKVERTRQYRLREKNGLSTEGFDESELLSEDYSGYDKMYEFGRFFADFLKESGYEQKLDMNKVNKIKAFNRYIQNFAERLEKKGFEFKEELLSS